MDAKSLAKSKRAHSLHHSKKPHSIQKAKAASAGSSGDAGSGNKALGKQVKEKARQSALPSNWDRYEEEFEGSDEQFGESLTKSIDVSFPRSKGADYRHLIAEAQSQQQSNSCSESFLSLDDIFPGDFKIGVGPILSARGEGILSWIGDDNFVVEDETAGNPEAAFLSLNLNALAELLEKANLSERLYIEADLLPPELAEDHTSTTINKPQSDETEARGADLSEDNKVAKKNTNVNVQTKYDSFNQGSDTSDLNSKEGSKKFEATAVEAELDMLLDSFSETKFLDSPEASAAQAQITRTAPSSSRTKTFSTELDDVLDDLLGEASNSSDQNVSHRLGASTATSNEIRSSSSQSVSKSKVLDDFDSWLDTI